MHDTQAWMSEVSDPRPVQRSPTINCRAQLFGSEIRHIYNGHLKAGMEPVNEELWAGLLTPDLLNAMRRAYGSPQGHPERDALAERFARTVLSELQRSCARPLVSIYRRCNAGQPASSGIEHWLAIAPSAALIVVRLVNGRPRVQTCYFHNCCHEAPTPASRYQYLAWRLVGQYAGQGPGDYAPPPAGSRVTITEFGCLREDRVDPRFVTPESWGFIQTKGKWGWTFPRGGWPSPPQSQTAVIKLRPRHGSA
jgi:hypothetical protein